MERFFFSRHSDRPDKSESPKSERHDWVTEKGVEMMRETSLGVKEMIDEASLDAVILIAGATEADRTKQAAHIVGEVLEEEYQDDPAVRVVPWSKVEKVSAEEPGFAKLIQKLANEINDHPDQKVIIDAPIYLKGFSLQPYIRDYSGKLTELAEQITNTAHELHAEELQKIPEGIYRDRKAEELGAKEVFMKEAIPLGEYSPQLVAERQMKDINRLREFAKRYIGGDREVILGFVGHAWSLDALVSYLANEGRADYEGFQKAGDQMIQMAEMGKVIIEDDKATLVYRGKEFDIPKRLFGEGDQE